MYIYNCRNRKSVRTYVRRTVGEMYDLRDIAIKLRSTDIGLNKNKSILRF